MEAARIAEQFAYYIPFNHYIEGEGYQVAVVKEYESGYYLTDWVWGPTLDDAKKMADVFNRRLGLSDDDVDSIIMSSMFASMPCRGTA